MRDMLWVIIPIAAIFYFIAFPDQWAVVLEWLNKAAVWLERMAH